MGIPIITTIFCTPSEFMTWIMKSLPVSVTGGFPVAFLYVVLMAGLTLPNEESPHLGIRDEKVIQHFWEEIMVQIDDLWLWVYVYSQHDQLFEPPGEQALIIRPTILLGGDTGFFKKNATTSTSTSTIAAPPAPPKLNVEVHDNGRPLLLKWLFSLKAAVCTRCPQH